MSNNTNQSTNNEQTNTASKQLNSVPSTAELLQAANKTYVENEIVYLEDENRKIDEILQALLPTTDIEIKTFNILTQVKGDNQMMIDNLVQQLELTTYEVKENIMSDCMSSGYSSFLAEVSALAKLNKSSGEQLVTQMENQPLQKVPKLSDNKKFLGRLRATRRYVTYGKNEH